MLGEFWYNGMEVCTMLGEFWYNGMEVCTMLGVLVQWYGGLYHVRGVWYNGIEVCTMLGGGLYHEVTMLGEFWYNGM